MSRRKIYVVAPGGLNGPGGIGRLVAETAAHWTAARLQPELRILDTYGDGRRAWIPLHLGRTLLQIAAGAARHQIALVHVHMAARGSALRKLAVVGLASHLRLPVIVHMHGSRIDEWTARLPPRLQHQFVQALRRADRIIVVGEAWRRFVIDRLGVDAARVRLVANAVHAPTRQLRPASAAGCRLVFVGQLRPEKGIAELFLALSQLADLNWQLSIAGEGDAHAYRKQVSGDIAARVRFAGWLPKREVEQLLAAADVFVLPSHNEGLSMAMLEAMAHACAIVATDAGGTIDAVRDEVDGLIVPPRDVQALAAALRRVIADAALRERLQSAAQDRFEQAFRIEAHCRQLLEIYAEVAPLVFADVSGLPTHQSHRPAPAFLGARHPSPIARRPSLAPVAKALIRSVDRIDDRVSNALLRLRRERPALLGLLLHGVYESAAEVAQERVWPAQPLLVHELATLIQHLLGCGYRFIAPADLLGDLDPHGHYALLSFDDGYANNLRALPVLRTYAVPATIFAAARHVREGCAFWWDVVYRERRRRGTDHAAIRSEVARLKRHSAEARLQYLHEEFGSAALMPIGDTDRPLTAAELRQIGSEPLLTIGNHGLDHVDLTAIEPQAAQRQIAEAQSYLASVLGAAPLAIAYPNGNCNGAVIAAALAAGLRLGMTASRRKNHLPLDSAGRMRIGRAFVSTGADLVPSLDRMRSDFQLRRILEAQRE